MESHLEAAGGGVDWEARYQTGDTPWDKGAAHPALLERLARNPLSGDVLVPGCGAGHDARAISANGARKVVGLDIAPAALNRAHAFPNPPGLEFRLEDFLARREPQAFDALFEHTCLCAIPPDRRLDYLEAAGRCLRNGGLFLGVLFTNPDNPANDAPPFRCRLDEMKALFSQTFEILEIRHGIPTFPERENREVWVEMQKRSRGNA
jgi:SAM-dependent methyltransferase